MEFKVGQSFRMVMDDWWLIFRKLPPEIVFAWAELFGPEPFRIVQNIQEYGLAHRRIPEVDSLVVIQQGTTCFAVSILPVTWQWGLFRTVHWSERAK
jgi:hypothetical protein